MNTLGIISVVACLASICAKIYMALKVRGLGKIADMERGNYQTAKNALGMVEQRLKALEAEKRQLDARRNTIDRSIKTMEAALDEMDAKRKEEEALRKEQESFIKGSRSRR